jgi:hypothetical protein
MQCYNNSKGQASGKRREEKEEKENEEAKLKSRAALQAAS